MPWKECNPMDERLKFIARLLDGEKMAGLCREFGISRKTGYKILTRYNEVGLEGLTSAKRVSALSKHLLEPVRCSLLGRWRGGTLTVPFHFPCRTPATAPRFVCQPPGPSLMM